MEMNRRAALIWGAAGCFALAMPLGLLWPRTAGVARDAGAVQRPVMPPPVAAITAIYDRPLLAPADAVMAPVDAPALVGIAGRLNRDAVALVRLADGGSRSLGVGASVDGWRLESLAIDAAFFTRGSERVRVAMPSVDGDNEPAQR